jgi:DNA-binding XRE family transcriptional regulator
MTDETKPRKIRTAKRGVRQGRPPGPTVRIDRIKLYSLVYEAGWTAADAAKAAGVSRSSYYHWTSKGDRHPSPDQLAELLTNLSISLGRRIVADDVTPTPRKKRTG